MPKDNNKIIDINNNKNIICKCESEEAGNALYLLSSMW